MKKYIFIFVVGGIYAGALMYFLAIVPPTPPENNQVIIKSSINIDAGALHELASYEGVKKKSADALPVFVGSVFYVPLTVR